MTHRQKLPAMHLGIVIFIGKIEVNATKLSVKTFAFFLCVIYLWLFCRIPLIRKHMYISKKLLSANHSESTDTASFDLLQDTELLKCIFLQFLIIYLLTNRTEGAKC
jgi:hypothetical protein